MKRKVIKIGTVVLIIVGLLIFSLQVSIVYPAVEVSESELISLQKMPQLRAFLDMIAYAEGTNERDGYRIQYTRLKFNSYHDHPRQVICALYKGEQLCSSAAGRYQFLKATWDRVGSSINANNFGPYNQDLGAIYLMLEHNGVEPLLRGDLKTAIERVNKVWASLPGSPYGQPTKTYKELEKVYKRRLRYHTSRLKRQRNFYPL